MQMKFDKDLVLKHKFWIVLALCVPFSIAAIFILTTRVSGQIAEQHKKIVGTLKAVGSAPKVPMRDINEAKFAAMVEQAKKSIVWARAWDEQKHLFVWPKEVEDRFDFQNGLFVYEIAIEAKQEDKEAAPEPKAEPKEEKDEEKKEEKGDPNPLSGTIIERAADYLMVKGRNGKEYKFRRTEKIKFTGLPEGQDGWLHIPQGAKVTVSYNRGKYFLHDGLTNSEQPAYMKFGVYHSQIEPIIRQVDPVGLDGKGVVQLKDWAYIEGKRPPSSPFLK